MVRKKVHNERKKPKNPSQIVYRNPEFNVKLMDMETIKDEGFDNLELNE